jgi:hypothetical protein
MMVGGFAGDNFGTVTNSYAAGSVNGNEFVGGFVGTNWGGSKISNCYATGSTSGLWTIGGFVGEASGGIISRSYATGAASGTIEIGGFAGYFVAGTISNSYATGSASASQYAGGFLGMLDFGTALNCYSTGTVSATFDAGGFIGYKFGGTVTDCYWDNVTSGKKTSSGGTGKNTTEMKQEGTFSNWNFTSPWSIVENNTYPYLTTLKPIIHPKYLNLLNPAYEDGLYLIYLISKPPIHPAGNKAGNWTMQTDTTGWLSLNSSTGILTGTPTNADVGVWSVNITVNDTNGAYGRFNFTLTVANKPPEITGIDITTATAEVPYSSDYNSTDDGSGNVTWKLDTDASWLEVNKTTGVLFGTPPNNQPGTHSVKVTVFDGNGGTDFRTFTITVTDINDDPVITTSPQVTCPEDVLYYVLFTATDADPVTTVFSWSLDTNASWLTLDGSYLHGTPDESQVGKQFNVGITVYDGSGGSDELIYELSVTNTNDLPQITTTPITTAVEDLYYNLNLTANDPDAGDELTWSLNSGPQWLELNTATWILEGTPENDDVGYSEVNISVGDGKGGTDWKVFTLVVENTNDYPVITTDPPHDTNEDTEYNIKLTATDEDPVATLFEWSLDTDADWLSLDGNHLHGTPTNSDVGSFQVNVTVSDGMGGSDFLKYTLVVNNTNDAPEWKITPSVQIITEGEELILNSEAVDADGDSITYSISSEPSSDIAINASSGEITWASPSAGNYTVVITATDGAAQVEHSFAVIVNSIPVEPQPDPDPDPDPEPDPDPDPKPDPDKNVSTDETDSDSDGMPDLWEKYFGLNPENPSDALADPDNDDKTNLQEFKDKTSPLKDDSIIDDIVDDDKKVDDKSDDEGEAKSETQGLESPVVSIPLGLIIGVIIGIAVGMMMRARRKLESTEGEEEELEEE